MSTNRPLRVFLCHSSNDKPAVRELYQKLRAEPWIQPWLDEEELYPGQDWNMEIEKAIEATDVILVCLSNKSITKEGYVQKEIKTALDYSDYKPEGTVFIIPIRLEDCKPPIRLSKWHYADYFEGQRDRGLQRLLVSLGRRAESLELKKKEPQPQSESFYDKAIKHKELVEWFDNLEKEANSKPVSHELNLNKITLSTGMEFMCVPAGKFLMGDESYKNEKPQHVVNISYDYWMARYPITKGLYEDFVKSNGIELSIDSWEQEKNYPVVSAGWNSAIAYCKWLNSLLKIELPLGLVLRLPTEAEWEKAARGVDGRKYPWGNEFDENKCNTRESEKGVTQVGLYSPNGDSPYGCSDMAGNVWEWTHSLFRSYPYNVNDGREDEKALEPRVLRGGSYIRDAKHARSSYRLIYNYSIRGFRVCLAPPLPK